MKRYKNINEEIESCKPSTILEIGTWNGVRARDMLDTAVASLKTVGPPSLSINNKNVSKEIDVKYIGFDLFENIDNKTKEEELHTKINSPQKLAEDKLHNCNYELIVGNTKDTLPDFVKGNKEKIDFIFIDGGHSIETIQSDWDNVCQLMHQGTVVIFDDYYLGNDKFGCKSTVDKIIKDDKYVVEIFKEKDHVTFNSEEITIQLVKVTLK